MNLDSLSFSLTRINHLVNNLTKKNFKQTNQELSLLVPEHGLEADRLLLKALVSETVRIQWESDRSERPSGSAGSGAVHSSLLSQQPTALLNHPARITVLCHAIDRPASNFQKILKPQNQFFSRLARLFKLTVVQEVAFCLALRNSSKSEFVYLAQQYLKKRLLELVQCYLDTDNGNQAEGGGGLQDCSPEVLQIILCSLSHERFGLATVTKDLFVKRLQRDFPRELVPVILAPLLYPDDTKTPLAEMTTAEDIQSAMMDTTVGEYIRDIGYTFTSSVEECKNAMLNFGSRETTAVDVARAISVMIRYHTALSDNQSVQTPGNFWSAQQMQQPAIEIKKDVTAAAGSASAVPNTPATLDSWNIDIFILTLKEVAPSLNWKEVILQLDHPDFSIPDKQAHHLLFTILKQGLQSAGYPPTIFPVEYLCRHWTNLDGQMSLITNILKYPEIFTFGDYPFHPVSIDILKSPPEADNKEISTWRCLYLVELLLYAAERGFYMQVHELFKFPLQHCPDILILCLLQISPPITIMRQELLSNLIPIFLGNHPNSGIILHHAWHTQNPNIKPIVMHAMAEWYIRGDNDQSRLSRILDVAQDLKALSLLLTIQSFLFVIDLACLASRREYLKLDKWLSDKIREHGENFVSSIVKFLQRRCPPPMAGKVTEEQIPKAAQLPHETIGTMLACLHLCINSVQPELTEAIMSVTANCSMILNKTRPGVQNLVPRPHPFNPTMNPPTMNPTGMNPPGMNAVGMNPGGMNAAMNPAAMNPGGMNPGAMNPAGMNPAGMNPANMNQAAMNPGSMNTGMNPASMNQSGMNPGGMNPGNMNPGAMNPGAMNPGSMNPGAMNPGAMSHGVMNPPGMNPPGMNPPGMNPGGMNPGMNPSGMNPPGMNPVGMNPMSAVGLNTLGAGPIFATQVDPIAQLAPNVANMNLGAPPNAPFSIPGSLGPLVSTSGSPSRLMGAAPNSPFAMLPMQHGIPNMAALARMGPPPPLDKPNTRLSENPVHFPEMVQNVSKEVEDEANGYFQRIYNHPPHPTLSIDEVLDMLKKFQESPNKREREVFSCMLRNLFEEYKFFPQYPEKELHITAQLFGGIIEKGLVPSYVSLGLALRFVLDALKKPEGSKMYYFGIAALDRFKSRLKDYHKYCEHVLGIPHFKEFPPHLKEYVECGLQSQEPPSKPQGSILPATFTAVLAPNAAPPIAAAPYRFYNWLTADDNSPRDSAENLHDSWDYLKTYRSSIITVPTSAAIMAKGLTPSSVAMSSRPSIANATNIDTLLGATDKDEKITAPPEGVQDKTAFIFNNLSQLNLQTKCDELREIITEEYYPWLSQYLVMKRASIELNFHALYSNFLDVLKLSDIYKLVTQETFRNIRVLLHSDKGIANFSDRSLLKNLGHWLGMLTLGRNRPILQLDIDLKSLILEAYTKGQQELLYVIPFVAKVLESTSKSIVFRPPNPWTMTIMSVLAELHQEPDLKLNLKFEIEVLCKNLSIDVVDLTPTLYLKDPERQRMLEYQLSHPNKKVEASILPIQAAVAPIIPQHPIITQTSVMPIEEIPLIPGTPTGGMLLADPTMMSTTPMTEPRFNYIDVNVTSTSMFGQQIHINPHILLIQNYPHLKQYIKPALERSVQEWIHPVVDRSIKYALTTCEQIIKKDFIFETDDVKMRNAAHNMMRNLTAGMAMITCREQILSTMSTNLKASFLTALIPATPQQKDIVDSAAQILASDNMELGCAFIQKTAVEKALPELDKRLINEYESRKLARQEGRNFSESVTVPYAGTLLVDKLKMLPTGPTDDQIAVYDEFSLNIPGFISAKDRESGVFMPKAVAPELMQINAFNQSMNPGAVYGADEMTRLINDAELFLATVMSAGTLTVQAANTHALLECLIMARRNRDVVSACAVLQKAVEGLLDGLSSASMAGSADHIDAITRYRDLNTRALKMLQDTRAYGHLWTTKQITRCLIECREDLRYNLDAIDWLIREHLVNLPQYDMFLATNIDNGNNYMAVAFAMQIVQLYLVDNRQKMIVTETDLYNTIEVLVRILSHSRQPPPEGLAPLIDMLKLNQDPTVFLTDRAPVGPAQHIHSGMVQARDYEDPPGLTEKTDYLVREWMNVVFNQLSTLDIAKNFNFYVHRMNVNGILKTDDSVSRFFRIGVQMCISDVYAILSEERSNPPPVPVSRSKYYNMTDSFMKLVSMLVKNSGDSANLAPKINLLNKVLGIMAGCLMQDYEERGTSFHQLVYHRMFLILFLDLNQPEPVLESINFQVLTAFSHTLHILRPSIVPGFCYAWLDLLSHRSFVSRILAVTPQQKGWGMFSQLLIDLFRYLEPFLRNTELSKPVAMLYKGTLKVMLVLLHDFPEFLCDYHYGFCDEIPANCIQMRNLILSAFPRNMRLPDPFTPNLKVDLLPEIALPPRVVTNYASMIQSQQFKLDLDSYLKARAPVTFLSELRGILQVANDASRRYNHQLMNALVLYVGTQAIACVRAKGQTPNMSTIAHSAHMDIFQNLAVDLDHEGRYIFLNAIANQLRYPNSHTHYFSCALLYLFAEANSEAIQEQITRMLLERLIVNRPHPWGLLITFIELIKNPQYKFWDHDFVHCAPEIEKLFESVARSCLVEKTSSSQDENAE